MFTPAQAVTDAMRKLEISLDDHNGDRAHTMPAATTCVVGTDGAIRTAAASADYRWRVGPQDVLATLCAWGVMRTSARGPERARLLSRSPPAELSGPLATVRIRAFGGLSVAAGHAEQPRGRRAVAWLRLPDWGRAPVSCQRRPGSSFSR